MADIKIDISIHAPREGGDAIASGSGLSLARFQSTPPARGATRMSGAMLAECAISIHAPREGGDAAIIFVDLKADISIHAPREGGDIAPFTAM